MSSRIVTTVADAMLAWTGWKTETSPRRDDRDFVERYGHEQATKWLPVLHALEDEFYTSDACHTAADLQEMAVIASMQFRKKHQDIEESVVQALAWCYTFDFK